VQPSTPEPSIIECPHCRLINPPGSQRCECGYDFLNRRPPKLTDKGDVTFADIAVCMGIPLIGIILGFVRWRQGKRGAGLLIILSFVFWGFWAVLGVLRLMAHSSGPGW
jgi:hypothetical protein